MLNQADLRVCVFMREQSGCTSVRTHTCQDAHLSEHTPGDASTDRVDRPAEDVHHVLVY